MKILYVVPRYPWPPRRGDQVRTVQLLEALAGEHEVTLLAPDGPLDAPGPVARLGIRLELYRIGGLAGMAESMAQTVAGGMPLQSALFRHRDLSRRLRQLTPGADLVLLSLVRLVGHLADLGSVPLAVDLIDSLALNIKTRAAVDRPLYRPFLRYESHLLARAEKRMIESARRVFLVCDRDRAALAQRLPQGLRARLAVLPLAVPESNPQPPRLVGSNDPTLAITGNLGYFPNLDAARWFLVHVWPDLKLRRPDLRLLLAGDRPPPSLARLARRYGAELLPSPSDLRHILATAQVALAPTRCGSGVPIKVLEAWSVGVPVVASPYAAAGAQARDHEDALIATSPQEWVASIELLLDNPVERAALARAGRERIEEYRPEVVYARVREEMGRLATP